MTAARAEALGARAVVGPVARLAAELGSLALKEGSAARVPADLARRPWRADVRRARPVADDRRAPLARRGATLQKPGANRYGRPVHVVDRGSPLPGYSATSTIVASTALILTNAKPCAGRILSVSAAVLSGCNDLKTAFGRTLDATTRHGIALVFTEVNGCRYCKAVHTFQQAARRSLSTAPALAKKAIEIPRQSQRRRP